jgi:nucleoside-diphosphate-sugar epimerase
VTTHDVRAPHDEAELEERLSRPPDSLPAVMASMPGDLIILGAGGKMGPSLARMAKRCEPARRVIAVSRWSDPTKAAALRDAGVETISADLLDPRALAALPDVRNVVFMAGQKFGTTGGAASTWAMNAAVPAFAAERYAGSRVLVFSTGNVYPLTPVEDGGSVETDALAPVGEYAYSCLARERIFAAACERHGSPIAIVRLNYAHDLRYGVLTDMAIRIAHREAIDLRMSAVNVIWQGDANALALAALARASAPVPHVVNVAGPTVLRTRELADRLGARLGVAPVFSGNEGADALLSNSAMMHELLADSLLPIDTLMDWVVQWIRLGNRLLGKPTGFERRDGRF